MKKKILLFFIIFLFGITGVKAADVALVNGQYCSSISVALGKVTSSDQTTITLLVDRNENITIAEGKNIKLDLNGHTLGNNGANKTVITNNGTLEIINGTVTSGASSGMINNNSKGVLVLNGGTYKATGSRQVVYNKSGKVTITGNAKMESETSERATVHNLDNGTIDIISGEIIANNSYAIYNDKGTLNIGTLDEVYDQSKPVIQGKTYGVIANNKINVYDGIIKGITYHIGTANSANAPETAIDEGETKVDGIEEYSTKKIGAEVIDGDTYYTYTYDLDPSKIVKITFDPNGGEVTPTTKKILKGETIGSLPEPQKLDNRFDGWYTESTGGTKITDSTKPNSNVTYYAHWTYVDPNKVAYVEGVGYKSLADAIALGGKIKIMEDVIVTTNLTMNEEAELDLNGHTITFKSKSLIIKEKVTIDDKSSGGNGKITSNANFTVIVGEENNSTNGKLIHKGGTIEGLGKYGAIYNYETTIIDGGTVQGTATENSYVIYNSKNLTVKDGTVHSTNGRAIQVYKNATFVMDGGLVKSDATDDQVVNLYGDCSATINGGTIEGLGDDMAGIAMFGNTNLTVNGGTIKGSGMAVAGNGNEVSGNANITINGGELIATTGVGMYLPQRNSVTTINGGSISGPTGIEIRAAKLIVNDGTITGTSDEYKVGVNLNGTTSKGAAIVVSQHNTKQPIEVIINGGNLKALVPISEANPLHNAEEYINTISIYLKKGDFKSTGDKAIDVEDPQVLKQLVTGGTYTYNPIEYVKDGYGVVVLPDNRFEVTKIYNITIDKDSTDYVSVDKDKYPYKEIVKLTIKEKEGYEAVIEVKDSNGNIIKVSNNEFEMPESDVTIKVTYNEKVNPKTGDNLLYFVLFLEIGITFVLGKRLLTKKDI